MAGWRWSIGKRSGREERVAIGSVVLDGIEYIGQIKFFDWDGSSWTQIGDDIEAAGGGFPGMFQRYRRLYSITWNLRRLQCTKGGNVVLHQSKYSYMERPGYFDVGFKRIIGIPKLTKFVTL